MKKFCFSLLFLITFQGRAQEFELYWNAEDCAGTYNTEYVIQGQKAVLGVDYWDVSVDSIHFEVIGLSDSLLSIDDYLCEFTPIDTSSFSISAFVYYQGQEVVLTKNYRVFPMPILTCNLVPQTLNGQLQLLEVVIIDELTGENALEYYRLCMIDFELIRGDTSSVGVSFDSYIRVSNFETLNKMKIQDGDFIRLNWVALTPIICSQSIAFNANVSFVIQL